MSGGGPRSAFVLSACLVGLALAACRPSPPDFTGKDPDSLFRAAVVPVLRDQCEECHFEGGPMYRDMPFDDQEFVLELEDELLARLSGGGRGTVAGWLALTRETRREGSD